ASRPGLLVDIAAIGAVGNPQQGGGEGKATDTVAVTCLIVIEGYAVKSQGAGEHAADVIRSNRKAVSSLDFIQGSGDLIVVGGLGRIDNAFATVCDSIPKIQIGEQPTICSREIAGEIRRESGRRSH